jgi:phosphate-selective porin OprO/OprP
VYRDFDFLFVPDFGVTTGPQLATPTPQIQDAFINYRYCPALQLQAGKFKAPVGLELLQPDQFAFLNERGLPTDLVPNRDIGIELHGDLFGGVVSYAAGVFNGVGDARNSNLADFENDRAFDARLFFLPFKKSSAQALQGFGFGLGGSYESMSITNTLGLPATTGGSLPGYFTVGQQQFFAYNPAAAAGSATKPVVVASGDHWRLAPQGYYYYGPFSLLTEYNISDQRVSRTVVAPFTTRWLDNTAWQVVGGWVLTGEDAAYNGPVVPRHPFNPAKGGWGALQLVGRFSELSVDPAAFPLFSDPNTSARRAQEWSVGLNWWLNRNIRLNTSYSQTAFTGGGGAGTTVPATVTQQHEKVVFTRMQLAF